MRTRRIVAHARTNKKTNKQTAFRSDRLSAKSAAGQPQPATWHDKGATLATLRAKRRAAHPPHAVMRRSPLPRASGPPRAVPSDRAVMRSFGGAGAFVCERTSAFVWSAPAEGGARHGGGADDSARRAAQRGLRDDHRRTPTDPCNQTSKQTNKQAARQRRSAAHSRAHGCGHRTGRCCAAVLRRRAACGGHQAACAWAWATARPHAPCCHPHAHAKPCSAALRRRPGSRLGAQASVGRTHVFTQTDVCAAARAGARPDLLVRVRRRCGVQRRAGRLQNRT